MATLVCVARILTFVALYTVSPGALASAAKYGVLVGLFIASDTAADRRQFAPHDLSASSA